MIPGVAWLGVHCAEALNSFRVRNMNQAELKSPLISHLSWGHIEVEGHPPFKDTKVFPGGVGLARDGNTPRARHSACRCSGINRARRQGRSACLKGSGRDLTFAPKPWRFWPRTALRSKSYRPRLLWSASTSFVKACRSAGYSIPPVD